MIFLRPFRKPLAFLLLGLLLVCQGTMAAQRCNAGPGANDIGKLHSPCHTPDAGDKHGDGGALPVSPCQSPQFASDSWQPNLPAVAELPSLFLPAALPAPAIADLRFAGVESQDCGRPPPLTILHCRLRN